jgi:uncharacterized protein with von Willebrand factor type A (vWA) domain
LVQEITDEMTKGLTNLKVYYFHNNVFGYVWEKPARFGTLMEKQPPTDLKKVVKRKNKVIIYGDAIMSADEFDSEMWPVGNREQYAKMMMSGRDSLQYIERHSDAAVWINPVFKRDWEESDGSGTIAAAKEIIPMHDLSVGGVQDAIRELMKR